MLNRRIVPLNRSVLFSDLAFCTCRSSLKVLELGTSFVVLSVLPVKANSASLSNHPTFAEKLYCLLTTNLLNKIVK